MLSFLGCTGATNPGTPDPIIQTDYKQIRDIFTIEAGSSRADSLANPFPNPYNHSVGHTNIHIGFSLADSGNVKLIIQNAIGDSVIVYQDTSLSSGSYSAGWTPVTVDGTPLRAGLYFITLRAAPNGRNYIESHLFYIENNQ